MNSLRISFGGGLSSDISCEKSGSRIRDSLRPTGTETNLCDLKFSVRSSLDYSETDESVLIIELSDKEAVSLTSYKFN